MDVRSAALKHLIEKLVSMPSAGMPSDNPLEDLAEGEHPGHELDKDVPGKPGLSLTEIEIKGKKKPKGKM